MPPDSPASTDPKSVTQQVVRDMHFPEKALALEAFSRIAPTKENGADLSTLLAYLISSIPGNHHAIYAARGALLRGTSSEAVRLAASKAAHSPCKPGKRRGRPPKDPEALKAYREMLEAEARAAEASGLPRVVASQRKS